MTGDLDTVPRPMLLRVLLPTEVLVDEEITKIVAVAANGSFCLLPRHVDFVAALLPSVLVFQTADRDENFVAVDEGVLVKCGREVTVSTFDGVRGTELEDLRQMVEDRYIELDEHERKGRSALARLEAGTLRGLRELLEETRA